MGALVDFLLIVLFVAVPGAALCLQVIPARLGAVRFRDTDPAHAWMIIGQYAQGTFEQRFGYPSGYFYLDEKRSHQPARLVMREAQPSGAITDGCSLQISSLSVAGFEGGCGPGCMMFFAVIFIGAPFLIVSALDRFFRLILRSRVEVSLTASGPDTIAAFAFHGPGGYFLRHRYAQAFEKPVLPAALTDELAAPPSAAGTPAAGTPAAGGQHAAGPAT